MRVGVFVWFVVCVVVVCVFFVVVFCGVLFFVFCVVFFFFFFFLGGGGEVMAPLFNMPHISLHVTASTWGRQLSLHYTRC